MRQVRLHHAQRLEHDIVDACAELVCCRYAVLLLDEAEDGRVGALASLAFAVLVVRTLDIVLAILVDRIVRQVHEQVIEVALVRLAEASRGETCQAVLV